jgi:hypothetical protein
MRPLPFFLFLNATGFAAGTENLLSYDRPAAKWVEALPVGNGRPGAMVFGGGVEERLPLNADTFWSGGRRIGTPPASRPFCRRCAPRSSPADIMRPRAAVAGRPMTLAAADFR